MNTIRVMIVDDHDMVRTGLGVLLQTCDDIELVGEANNGIQAIEMYRTLKPDVVLMDLKMPALGGIDATRAIREQDAQARIIALSSFNDEELVYSVLQAGALSYLTKDISIDELDEAIRAAYVGKTVLAQEAAQALIRAANRPAAPGHDLTGRELEILALIVQGLSNADIAERIVVSQSTVKKHVSSILSKLNVNNRAEAVALAYQYKLVPR
jgi:two-component system, NarL family, response regulator LiaR